MGHSKCFETAYFLVEANTCILCQGSKIFMSMQKKHYENSFLSGFCYNPYFSQGEVGQNSCNQLF